ncbi:MAG TPA: hypothetical protein VIH22_05445 [Cyclobacteriaceae bacterium]|jgi:hypothetical protein
MNEPDEGQTPVFRTWKTWYRLVLGIFFIEVIVFYLLTTAFV